MNKKEIEKIVNKMTLQELELMKIEVEIMELELQSLELEQPTDLEDGDETK